MSTPYGSFPRRVILTVGDRAADGVVSDGNAGYCDGVRLGIQVRTPEARTEFMRGVNLRLTAF
jgi:hypothetical protein